MKIISTRNLNDVQFQQINKLWNKEYPINLKDRFGILLVDIENYNHYIIEDVNQNVLAWAVYFEQNNEIRFSVIVDHNYQGNGFGVALINQLKTELAVFYGWVIDHDKDKKENGEFYISPLNFYLKHGFEVQKDIRIDTELLKAVKIKWQS